MNHCTCVHLLLSISGTLSAAGEASCSLQVLDLLMEAGMSVGNPNLPLLLDLRTASNGEFCVFDTFVKDHVKQVSRELLEAMALAREEFADTPRMRTDDRITSKNGVIIHSSSSTSPHAEGIILCQVQAPTGMLCYATSVLKTCLQCNLAVY